jgi:hypothetical protein
MRPPLPGRRLRERSAPCFRRYLVQRCTWLLVGQQFQLQVAQRLGYELSLRYFSHVDDVPRVTVGL